jgi:hypothetical protein
MFSPGGYQNSLSGNRQAVLSLANSCEELEMDYISEVAHSLIINSVCISIVSPEFYTLIADWEKKCIPASVVVASVEELGPCTQTPASSQANLIDELKTIVNKNFGNWLQSQV